MITSCSDHKVGDNHGVDNHNHGGNNHVPSEKPLSTGENKLDHRDKTHEDNNPGHNRIENPSGSNHNPNLDQTTNPREDTSNCLQDKQEKINDAKMIKREDGEREEEKMPLSEEMKEEKIRFDDILKELGDFGRYQKIIYFLLFMPTIFRQKQ